MRIEKRNYSSSPWRLVDDDGVEVYEMTTLDHPDCGPSRVSMPVCGATKQEVIDRVLRTWHERTLALQIVHTWAKCDAGSRQTRAEAMADIIDRCEIGLGGG